MKRSSIARLCTATTMLSVILSAVLVAVDAPWWAPAGAGLIGMLAFLLGAWLRHSFRTVTRPLGIQRDYRAGWLLVGTFAAVRGEPELMMLGAAVLVIGLALIFSETSLGPRWSRLYPPVRNLPGVRSYAIVRPAITGLLCLELAATFALFLAPAVGAVTAWVALGLILVAGGIVAVLTLAAMALNAGVTEQRWEALRLYEPRFALYFSAPAGSEYQVRMWLPYLERIGEPWVIILRERRYLTRLAAQTTAPVVVATSLADLGEAMSPSLTTVFYVNNSFKNTHCVRYGECTHVQLLHGDSDKAPSFNPVTAMYDKVFVAGEMGIHRYAKHGVEIPRRKFELVGRPQVEDIVRVDDEGMAARTGRPRVLYAPTWQGYHDDTNFCSLPVAESIVRVLLAFGADVIFRPHPFSATHKESAAVISRVRALLDRAVTPESDHRFGKEAEDLVTLVDCMNLSDALITDVSSVPGDYLFSEKPFVMVKMAQDVTMEEFEEEFPLAAGAYVWDASNESELAELVASMLSRDPLRATRTQLRTYYLGDFAAETYSDNFVRIARACVNGS